MNVRHIEMNISKERFLAWAEWEFRSIKNVRDDEEVVVSFETKHLKEENGQTIPVSLEIYKKGYTTENGA